MRTGHVSGTCRTADKAKALCSGGVDAHIFDLDDGYAGLDPGGLEALAAATHVLATMAPIADLDRDPLLALHRSVLLGSPSLCWAGYLSTTSVYGDHAGGWVDELSETRGGQAGPRLRAEQEWLSLREGGRVASHAFRLAGIYGPGRSALDTVRRAQPPLPVHADASPVAPAVEPTAAGVPRFVSRVHVADISAVVLASMRAPAACAADAIYNVADDEPAPRSEVMSAAAALLELPPRPTPEGDGARARRRATDQKRVANSRMRALLQPSGLRYPTYREGLRAVRLAEQEAAA